MQQENTFQRNITISKSSQLLYYKTLYTVIQTDVSEKLELKYSLYSTLPLSLFSVINNHQS